MRRLDWHMHYDRDADGNDIPGYDGKPGCEDCREKFERSKHVCAFCWKDVSNRDFLKNDYHQSGKCRTRTVLKIPDRTIDKPMPYPWPNGFNNPFRGKYKPTKHKFFKTSKKEKTSHVQEAQV
jgi:hypothetical protein